MCLFSQIPVIFSHGQSKSMTYLWVPKYLLHLTMPSSLPLVLVNTLECCFIHIIPSPAWQNAALGQIYSVMHLCLMEFRLLLGFVTFFVVLVASHDTSNR